MTDSRDEDDDFIEEELLDQENTVPGPAQQQTLAQRWREWSRNRKLTITVEGKVPRMTIKGKILNDEIEDPTTQTRYVAFRGIPYAAPPIDDLRFQPTQPLRFHKSIFGSVVWKAYEDKEPCLQRDSRDVAHGAEDCLYLNVYLPRINEREQFDSNQLSECSKNNVTICSGFTFTGTGKIIGDRLPVLVYFHGGSFLSSSGDYQHITPDSIMKHDLIFVTVNYRIGPVGFLNMQTQSCRGNMGLKDQVQALRWIRDNIKRFRGDPKNVTISGHGAGATCVNLHLVSPLSSGLFHKAIISGGGIYCPWGFKGHRREFKELIRQASGEKDDLIAEQEKEEDTLEYKARKVVTDYFMQKSAEDFLRCATAIMDDYVEDSEPTQLTAYLGPSVEIRGENMFLPDTVPQMMLGAEPVPILAGIAKNEGNQVYIGQSTQALVQLVKQERQFRSFLEQHFQWADYEVRPRLDEIRMKYFGPNIFELSDREIEKGLVDLHTDICHRRFYENFKFGEKKEFPPLYVYEFDYYDKPNEIWHGQLQDNPRTDDKVAGHGDELLYLYCPRRIRETLKPFSPEVQHVVSNMCSLWANFCKTGTPKSDHEDVEWKPHTTDEGYYLHIGKNLELRGGGLNADRWAFLSGIIKEEPLIKSIQETPLTPEPPTILAPLWNDPESMAPPEKWVSKQDRRPSGASSLTRKSSKSSSRKLSQRSSISSHQFVPDTGEELPSTLSAALSRFGMFGLKKYARVGASTTDPQSQLASEPQPGTSQSQERGTPPSLPQRYRQRMQTPASPAGSSQGTTSEHDQSQVALLHSAQSAHWWSKIIGRRLKSEETQESSV